MSLLSRLSGAFSPFLRKAAASFGLRFGGLFLQFAGAVVVARILGVEGYGVYTYAFTWATIGGGLLGLGLGPLAVRELPRYLTRGEHGLVRGYLAAGLGLILATATLSAAGLALVAASGLTTFDISWPLLVLAALVQALVLGMSAVLGGFQKIVLSQFVENVLRQSLFLIAVLALALWGYVFTAEGMFVISLVSSVPVILLMAREIRRAMQNDLPTKWPEAQYTMRFWLASALPLLAMNLVMQLQTGLNVLLIGGMADAADVGRYRAASRGADLMMIANGIATQVLGPMLSRALAQNHVDGREEAQRLISQSAVVSAALGLSIAAILGFGASFYLGLFGPGFVPAARALQILAVAQALGILCGPVAVVLIMLGHERIVLFVNLGALAVNLGLNLLLIPRFGIEGAAIATSVGVLLVKLVLLGIVLRRSGFDPTLWTPLMRGRSKRGGK